MNPPTGIPALSPRDAAAAVEADGALIVDVRERDEFVAERAPGVALMPLSEFVARHEELPKDRPLLMVCAAGSRSASATMFLLQNGWTDVRNVTGGMMAWAASGLPTRGGRPDDDEGAIPG
ncbi:MAG TPA: rhodanese-like domain-containing protein [Candidatus Limnocylindrales bacterium]|jgi:rhodanese-related sulfurtransferase